MKIRFCAALLLAALSVTIFAGCAAPAQQQLEVMEEKIDNRLDAVEDAIENRMDAAEEVIVDTLVPAAPAPVTEPAPTQPAPTQPAPTQPASADPVLISKEDAIAIALADAGLTQDQVTRLRAEFDYDNGRPEYEVDFHYDRWEYDYEINAKTGDILSRDKDRED